MQREDIANSLIVSCQPVPGGPMDSAQFVTGFARAALEAGAKALRIESVPYVAAARLAVREPIIGIVKRDLTDSPVRITPYLADVEALAEAGADIIAFDATDRVRPIPVEALVKAVKARNKLTMADCSCLDDARRALAAGVDFVGTTLSGYVGGPEPEDPDIALIAQMRTLSPYVIAEGRIRSPEQAAAAARAGACAVVVGSAITRTEHVTSWFHQAISGAYAARGTQTVLGPTVLGIDIGGTKTMAALVSGGKVVEDMIVPTAREAGPDAWLASLAQSTSAWSSRFSRIGIAVTGLVHDGRWSALNPATLGIPDGYPLVERASAVFGKPVCAFNDAQAAAWGEYKFGAGQGCDIVFLTISTGIGGGIVCNGRLLSGLAGHFGLIRGLSADQAPLEDSTSGRWIASQALKAGFKADAADVFGRALKGEAWADAIVSRSASRVATLCRDIQMMFDPKSIVIGGSIGLADGYLDRVRAHLGEVPPRLSSNLVAAKLAGHAGVIGVADLAEWAR
ncbi:ROK family protein [Mesorhizobium sp. M7A.F.Ca.US.006.04.2.1]|uniref:putative N-acetylmannosamine-6-phosphate 2-epimerase n=2 Tax=Mesorhizobium TaxID=68287 RepID=UPI000FC9FB4B|nr:MULTISPECIES: putative N-acetylmannosamine-6-phosphate 2-epimerase [unclassified Mesorhizobium]RUX78412.1 ROK family protein [Mesorhizobium sp. M7A.F.Ca.US.005.03.1.1]RUY16995.1 ROK family protein [Mesorhizobium sp. M7A.F.Ca.US.005.03.2.1]RUY31450.1 ROK family protein [Mesorhizobium sp. M7A.F.Ca.US.001.04.2.1]RUY45133.1 ROK family protein [Mesorhizobium sp. M7A.F.Ca.US.001.04.1.1]RVA08113.1 ROK family protein [Mesorhizobium sp. M7A.F.Ca.US.001.02.1.1]